MLIFYICHCGERGDTNMGSYTMCMIIPHDYPIGTLKYIKYKTSIYKIDYAPDFSKKEAHYQYNVLQRDSFSGLYS